MLIHSPNWLGDVVMALPAFRVWLDRHADEPVHILAKRRVASIWGFVRDIDSVIVLEEGIAPGIFLPADGKGPEGDVRLLDDREVAHGELLDHAADYTRRPARRQARAARAGLARRGGVR